MMIFLLHCYSTAAMPYMGAQGGGGGGGGTIVGVRLFLEIFFQVGFSSHYGGLYLYVVGLFAFCSFCGGHKQGPYLHVGAFVLLRKEWGGGGIFGIVLL